MDCQFGKWRTTRHCQHVVSRRPSRVVRNMQAVHSQLPLISTQRARSAVQFLTVVLDTQQVSLVCLSFGVLP